MKLTKKITAYCLCLVALLTLSMSTITASAANNIDVKLISSALKAEPGDTFSVSYSFTNASDYKYGLSAFTSMLKYDHNKVRCVKVIHSTFNSSIMSSNRSLTGEVRTLYTYANLNKKPGVNTSDTFVTYVFAVVDNASGTIKLSLDFDTIVTTNYDKTPPENITLTYNKPSVSVEIVGGETESQVTSSNKPASSNTQSNVQSNAQSNSQTNSIGSSSKAPNTNAPDDFTTVDDKYLNPDFTQSDVASGEEQTFEIGDLTESQLTESVNNILSSTFSEAGIDPETVIPTIGSSDKNFKPLIFIGIGLFIVIAGAVAIIIIKNRKK